VTQAPRPERLPPEVQAARVAEYIASYVFKNDDVESTANFVAACNSLQKIREAGVRSKESIASCVLGKVANAVNKSISLGAVYVSHLLAGHDDAILSYDTHMFNLATYMHSRCGTWLSNVDVG